MAHVEAAPPGRTCYKAKIVTRESTTHKALIGYVLKKKLSFGHEKYSSNVRSCGFRRRNGLRSTPLLATKSASQRCLRIEI